METVIPCLSIEETQAFITKELKRPQSNKVLHAHPSPLQWKPLKYPVTDLLQQRLKLHRRDNTKINLYVGIPYCVPTNPPHCGFCLFPTQIYRGKNSMETYLDYLEKEIALHEPYKSTNSIASLYVGGGTPNLMNIADYERLMGMIEYHFDGLGDNIEKSLEGIPQLFTPKKISAIKRAGFNRVSMGVQQVDDKLIRYSGRKQNKKQVFNAIEQFKKHDLACSVDLIFGWPEQQIDKMLRDLQSIIDTGIQHITHYELNISGKSFFSRKLRALLPPIEKVYNQYLASRELLLENGFIQRTLYDWEKPTTDQEVVIKNAKENYFYEENLRYPMKRKGDKLVAIHSMFGLGYAAISFILAPPEVPESNWTTMNSRTLAQYYRDLDNGKLPVERVYIRSYVDLKISLIFQALQEMQIDINEYQLLFNNDIIEELAPVWKVLESRNWASIDKNFIRIKPKHHLDIPIIQVLIAAKRNQEIRRQHSDAKSTIRVKLKG